MALIRIIVRCNLGTSRGSFHTVVRYGRFSSTIRRVAFVLVFSVPYVQCKSSKSTITRARDRTLSFRPTSHYGLSSSGWKEIQRIQTCRKQQLYDIYTVVLHWSCGVARAFVRRRCRNVVEYGYEFIVLRLFVAVASTPVRAAFEVSADDAGIPSFYVPKLDLFWTFSVGRFLFYVLFYKKNNYIYIYIYV